MVRQEKLVLVISILASFVAFLDGSVVNVALPAIARELGGGLFTQQWVIDSYLITLGSLMLLAGSLADIFGVKKIMASGLWGFGAASVLCALAPSATLLIFARALQGIAGALLVPSSLAFIISQLKGAAQNKAIGTWTAWTGIAFIVGPFVGGFLVDAISWRLIFAINVLPIAVTLYLLRTIVLSQRLPSEHPVDYVGSLLCTAGLGGMVYGLIEQSYFGWQNPQVYLPLIVGVISILIFFWYEQHVSHPMLALDLFTVRNFLFGNISTLAVYAALSVAIFLLSIFLQQTAGYSALLAGLALLPVTIIMFLLSPRFGALSGRFGPRLFMSSGPIIAAAGFFILLSTASQSMPYWTSVLPGLIIFGLGLAATVAPLTSAVLSAAGPEHAGIASAINNAVSRIAGLIAVALIGIVTGPTLDLLGFKRALLFTCALLVGGGVVALVGIRNVVQGAR